VSFDGTAGQWDWALRLDGRDVAVCVHAYQRRIECRSALDRFLRALSEARPDQDEIRELGPNALRMYGSVASRSISRAAM
jgi:hypothetical protein